MVVEGDTGGKPSLRLTDSASVTSLTFYTVAGRCLARSLDGELELSGLVSLRLPPGVSKECEPEAGSYSAAWRCVIGRHERITAGILKIGQLRIDKR